MQIICKTETTPPTGIWHLCEVNVNNNARAAVYIHSEVKLYPKRAFPCAYMCARVLLALIVTHRITAVAFGRRRAVPELYIYTHIHTSIYTHKHAVTVAIRWPAKRLTHSLPSRQPPCTPKPPSTNIIRRNFTCAFYGFCGPHHHHNHRHTML